MINSLQLHDAYRDWVGEWNPPAIAQLSPLFNNRCYALRYYLAPRWEQQIIPANGYLESSVAVKPGSLVWGIFYRPILDPDGVPFAGFNFNMRSVSLDLPLFSDPVPSTFITGGDDVSRNGGFIFPCPYPAVGNGLFKMQFWNSDQSEPQRVSIVLGAAEVAECRT